MGYIEIPWNFKDYTFGFIKKEDLNKFPTIKGWLYNPNIFPYIMWDLKYHSSWDWLIPACKKWDELIFPTDNPKLLVEYCRKCDLLDDMVTCYEIEAVFEQLVKNIKWYNGLETRK